MGHEWATRGVASRAHRSMSTTKLYLHLAGVVFRNEAEALERRVGLQAGAGEVVVEDVA